MEMKKDLADLFKENVEDALDWGNCPLLSAIQLSNAAINKCLHILVTQKRDLSTCWVYRVEVCDELTQRWENALQMAMGAVQAIAKIVTDVEEPFEEDQFKSTSSGVLTSIYREVIKVLREMQRLCSWVVETIQAECLAGETTDDVYDAPQIAAAYLVDLSKIIYCLPWPEEFSETSEPTALATV